MPLSRIANQGLTGPIGGRRNLVINGAMNVAQRGQQTGQTGNSYTACDRFLTAEGGAAVTTSSQSTDVPSGQGFANSLEIDITTADTDISSNDFFIMIQRLEGQDLQHLLYGTSSAKQLTVSFWVKSPKTGTHICELRHNDASYFNSQAYTITSANTWQNVTLTYDGYATTAFDDDNNQSLAIQWWFAAGSNFSSGTLNSNTWHNTATNRAVGQVNCLDSTSNEIYLTGVQVEVGSVATEFENRSFGEELALCQRYFIRYPSLSDAATTMYYTLGSIHSSSVAYFTLTLPVPMRTQPDLSISGTDDFQSVDSGTIRNLTNLTLLGDAFIDNKAVALQGAGTFPNEDQPTVLRGDGTSGGNFAFDAEL